MFYRVINEEVVRLSVDFVYEVVAWNNIAEILKANRELFARDMNQSKHSVSSYVWKVAASSKYNLIDVTGWNV